MRKGTPSLVERSTNVKEKANLTHRLAGLMEGADEEKPLFKLPGLELV